MTTKTFGVWPAIFIFCLSVGLANHVLIIPFLLNAAKRDAWMCVLIALIASLPWIAFPLYGLLKKMNKEPIDDWLKRRMPALLANTLIGLFLLLLVITCYETLIITASWTATTYLPRTPPMVVCGVLLVLGIYAASSNLRTIAYVSCVLLPLVVLLGDFVMSANMPHKDYHYMLPILENGFSPVLKGAFYSFTATCELFALLFIQHHIKGNLRRWHLVVLALGLALLTFGPLTAALSEFGPVEAAKMRFPAFAQWRIVSVGRYFEHVDFFAIFQWLSGALIRISLTLYIFVEFGPFRRLKHKWIAPVVTGSVFMVAAHFSLRDMLEFNVVLQNYFLFAGVGIALVVLLLWFMSFLKPRGNKREPAAKEERLG
ncbi:GerAB/ArcD/ProY family transporter [Paenibacillus harenae]|uniref:GerAB/ArcD/ProY family transporter n=1 Tax=Paenibacillus harenae TaxID=306543 RepID=UPI0027950E21|nr:endospore germination permease [Paenibacillus harenae]MDQ0061152.1 spore germination protein (amino acid permease) [Paenibacillus harenae]